jgi:hypothetical protein
MGSIQRFNLGSTLTGIFGEQLVAQQTPEIQLVYSHGLNTEILMQTNTGSGVSTVANSFLNVATTGTVGTCLVKSKNTIVYTAGVGVQAMFSAIFTVGTGNTKQHIGMANSQDGFLMAYENGVFGIIYRRNNVDTFIPQSTFSEDKIDGTGKSLFNIDVTKGNLFKIEFQYLGVGDIFFYCKNDTDNTFINFHVIRYTNQNITTSVLAPYYKAWIYVENTGNPTAIVTLKSASFSASHQGKKITRGKLTPIRNTKTGVTTETNIFSVRSRPTINGVTNFIPCQLNKISLGSSAGNATSVVRLILNATLGGTPSFVNVSTTNSVLQKDTAGTTVTGGTELLSFSLPINGEKELDLSDYGIDLEPNDTLTIAGSTTNGTSFNCSLSFKELW